MAGLVPLDVASTAVAPADVAELVRLDVASAAVNPAESAAASYHALQVIAFSTAAAERTDAGTNTAAPVPLDVTGAAVYPLPSLLPPQHPRSLR